MKRRPTGSAPFQSFAIDWLTIATSGASGVSPARKSRPARSGTPRVSKYRSLVKFWSTSNWLRTPSSAPSSVTGTLPGTIADCGTPPVSAAARTPGELRSESSTCRSKRCWSSGVGRLVKLP